MWIYLIVQITWLKQVPSSNSSSKESGKMCMVPLLGLSWPYWYIAAFSCPFHWWVSRNYKMVMRAAWDFKPIEIQKPRSPRQLKNGNRHAANGFRFRPRFSYFYSLVTCFKIYSTSEAVPCWCGPILGRKIFYIFPTTHQIGGCRDSTLLLHHPITLIECNLTFACTLYT